MTPTMARGAVCMRRHEAAISAWVVAVYVIPDLEYPRLGLIRIDAFDRALMELRESMQ